MTRNFLTGSSQPFYEVGRNYSQQTKNTKKKLKYPFSCFLFSDMNKPNHIEMLVKPVLTKSCKGCIYLEEEGDREKKSPELQSGQFH